MVGSPHSLASRPGKSY
ncbi:rCG41124 [Rattus norvegicus]|uniref:RCG41124 n=1 Tax=Rattus norvegicus TaxID=10116 RepID=A6KIN3_RAT|nr:rCG41124 [Rattus norvegicus]